MNFLHKGLCENAHSNIFFYICMHTADTKNGCYLIKKGEGGGRGKMYAGKCCYEDMFNSKCL